MSNARESMALPAGSDVGGYRLGKVQASWGFYLTYPAENVATGQTVAVHELLPEEFAARAEDGTVRGRFDAEQENLAWARERFLREGRDLAACAHPAVQKVLGVVEANGTAYWVTPRDEPRNFKIWLQELGRPPTGAELRSLLEPVLAALEQVHAAGLHHANLKPESIQITASGQPVLAHFAGARQAIARHCHDAGAATAGYSPTEQYDPAKAEGAWTDVYSLAAVLHRAIVGHAPPEAEARVDSSDPYERLAGRYAGQYRESFLIAIDAALAVDPAARPQSIRDWRRMLGAGGSSGAIGLARRRPIPVLAAAAVLVLALWFVFRPGPAPDPKIDQDQEQAQNEEEKKAQEDNAKADAETKAAEEQKKREEEQKEQQMAEQKSEQERVAAEKAAAAKAEAEKQAAEQAARLAQEAAQAAAQAEAAARAAEEAAQAAKAEKSPAGKAAAEKAAAQAAAEAAARKTAADEAGRLAEEAKRAAEKAAQEKKQADEKAADLAAGKEEAKRKAAESAAAAAAAQAEAERRAADKEKMAGGKSPAQEAAEKMAAEKAAQAAAQKAEAEQQVAAQRMAAQKAAEEKRAAEAARVAAAEKAAAEKAAAENAAAERMAADKAAQAKADPNQGKYKKTDGKDAPDSDDNSKNTTSQGSAGPGIPGVWETTATDAQGRPKRRLIIYDDGRYLISDNENWRDSGVILARAGRIQMLSDNSREIVRSGFKLRSLSKIVTSGALGDDEWKRVSASPGNDPDAPKKK